MDETWQAAVTLDELIEMHASGKNTGIVWIKVFAAWLEFDEHQRKGKVSEAERREIDRTLSAREGEGRQNYGWSYEQIAWRRDQIRAECGGSEDVFDEYYPEDDVRCWLVSGRPRFNMTALMGMEALAKSYAPNTGHLTRQEDGKVTWNPRVDGNGDIQVWETPREGMRYLAGCDPATGASQTTGKNPDRSSVQVWRQGYYDAGRGRYHNAKLVARVRAPFFGDGDEVAGHIGRLSAFYGNGIVVPEVNMGLQVLTLLQDIGVPLYKRTVPSARVGTHVEQFGFKLTDQEQRRSVIEALATAIREGGIDVPCPHWVHEAKMFITTNTGRDEAREHDDDVMCGGMCWHAMPSATEYRRVLRKKRGPADLKDWRKWGGK